jgi:hypothetical protein
LRPPQELLQIAQHLRCQAELAQIERIAGPARQPQDGLLAVLGGQKRHAHVDGTPRSLEWKSPVLRHVVYVRGQLRQHLDALQKLAVERRSDVGDGLEHAVYAVREAHRAIGRPQVHVARARLDRAPEDLVEHADGVAGPAHALACRGESLGRRSVEDRRGRLGQPHSTDGVLGEEDEGESDGCRARAREDDAAARRFRPPRGEVAFDGVLGLEVARGRRHDDNRDESNGRSGQRRQRRQASHRSQHDSGWYAHEDALSPPGGGARLGLVIF